MTTDATSSYFHTVSGNSSEVAVENSQVFNGNIFLILASIYLVLALTAIIGNRLVSYSATKHFNTGPLRHMDDVIKS